MYCCSSKVAASVKADGCQHSSVPSRLLFDIHISSYLPQLFKGPGHAAGYCCERKLVEVYCCSSKHNQYFEKAV